MNDFSEELKECTYLCFGSIVCNFIVMYCLSSSSVSSTKIIRNISAIENIFLFTKLIGLLSTSEPFLSYYGKLPTLLQMITTSLLNVQNKDLLAINQSLCITMKNVGIFLSICLCYETNTLLKNPFSNVKTRLNAYYYTGFLMVMLGFPSSLAMIYHNKEEKLKSINNVVTATLFLLLIIIGIFSLFHIFVRFCLNKSLKQSCKNIFVVKHFFYIIFYILILFTEPIASFKETFLNKIAFFSMGIIMLPTRINKLFFTKRCRKSKVNVNLLISNLNAEFTCCILYGLTQIFLTKKVQERTRASSKKKKNILKKIYPIKYKKVLEDTEEYTNIELMFSEREMSSVDTAAEKIKNKNKNKNDQDASIIEYCDDVFSEIRGNDEITYDVILNSFVPGLNKNSITKVSESQGKSGSFFFHSYDHKFLVKTISNEELECFLNTFIPDYHEYLSANRDTLITKIYGVYSIVIKGASKVNVILMQNLINCEQSRVYRVFDLKGSSIKRQSFEIGKARKMQALKDLDYLWITRVEKSLVNFTTDQTKELQYLLQNDINFFTKLNIMDYSLLFIIIHFPSPSDKDYDSVLALLGDPKYLGHVYKSRNMKYIYIIGIIDYLQEYNMKKYLENRYKKVLYGEEVINTSAVEPIYYGKRFFEFMKSSVFIYGTD